MSIRTYLTTVALAAIAQAAPAAVWIVDQGGGGDFPEIAAAVAAAGDGDTILVRSGTYLPFSVVSKGLEIVEEDGATVFVARTVAIRSTAAGQTVTIRGLETTGPLANGDREEGLLVASCDGPVMVEDGTFRGGWLEIPASGGTEAQGIAYSGARVAKSAHVVLTRCELVGRDGWLLYLVPGIALYGTDGGDGLRVAESAVTLYECTLTGGDGGSDWDEEGEDGGDGGRGLSLDDALGFAAGSTLAGGDGGDGGNSEGFIDPYPGDGGDGGAALFLRNGSDGRILDVTLAPGQGGAGGLDLHGLASDGAPGEDGPPIDADAGSTVDRYRAPVRTCEVPSPSREGDLETLTLTGEPMEVFVLFTSAAIDPEFRADLHGTLVVPTSELPILVTYAVLPASGTVSIPLVAPPVAAGAAQGFVFQALMSQPHGPLTLSSPTRWTVFDSAF